MAGLADESCANWPSPEAGFYLSNLETGDLVITVICGVVVVITTVILLSELIFIYDRRTTWPQPEKTIWLLGLYTVFGWTAFVGVLVPRAGDLGAMIATMYLSASFFVFRRLMVFYFGGKKKMMERLEGSEYKFICLPNMKVTKTSFIVTEMLVLQFTILAPLLVFIEAVIIANMQEHMDNRVYLGINIIVMISTFVALYGLLLLYRISHQHLAYAGIRAKFICLKLIVGLSALQKLLMSILASREVVPCASGLSHKDNAVRIGRILLIFEAFLISILARVYYKRDQNLHLHPELNGQSVDPEDDSDTAQIVTSGSSDEPSELSSTRVGSDKPRYGATDDVI